MDLREYLFRNRITVKKFSEKMECARTHISEILHGRRKPSKRLAQSIENATNGEVTVAELMAMKPRDSTSE